MRFAAAVVRHAWLVLLSWVALAASLWTMVPPTTLSAEETATALPPQALSRQAERALREYFPAVAGFSQAVIVFERSTGPLTPRDLRAIQAVAAAVPRISGKAKQNVDLAGVRVLSPRDLPVPASANPLISRRLPQGQAALVLVNIPANFISVRSYRIVEHIHDILARMTLPAGLRTAVTGFSGFGHDYALAVERSSRRASYVTLIAIIVILLLVYRAPVAAAVPLLAIGLALSVVFKVLDLPGGALQVGTAERIFVFVLAFGAGTDYSLLLISRYREDLRRLREAAAAAANALASTGRPIVASALTNALGLLSLSVGQILIFRITGIAVSVAFLVTMLASLTLVPAVLALIGRRTFWPLAPLPPDGCSGSSMPPAGAGDIPLSVARRNPPDLANEQGRFWSRLARGVTHRPRMVLTAGLLAAGIPAAVGARVPLTFDTLTMLGPQYSAVSGLEMVRRYWGVGYAAPADVVVVADRPLSLSRWLALSRSLTAAIAGVPGVAQVLSLSAPLGTPARGGPEAGAAAGSPAPRSGGQGGALSAVPGRWGIGRILSRLKQLAVEAAIDELARRQYVSPTGRAMRMEVVLAHPPLRLRAMAALQRVREAADAALSGRLAQSRVLIGGETAEMLDLRTITSRDFIRIASLTLAVVFLVVAAMLHRWLISVYMVACTMLTFLATLGLSYAVFGGLLGYGGLDWKVRLLVFVVMVAVGVDYSLFLVVRMRQESLHATHQEAIRLAVVRTGPVISSAGLIMAASLGSLMAGDLELLHQLGFAMVVGMLLDTFVVRPLLIPAFVSLRGRL